MLRELQKELGIPGDYSRDGLRPSFAEAAELTDAGPSLTGRMQQLTPATAACWQQMQTVAQQDGVTLLLVSGYRSFAYQADLIRKKIEGGQSLSDILAVNAAPGFSEHHTGNAIDIASPGTRPLTEEFETSAAFAWLLQHAGQFGFSMSYPRQNPQGFIYEPWHWARKA